MKRLLAGVVLMILLTSVVGFRMPPPNMITQEELVRNTQELFDAVAAGNQAPFQKVLCR
jgi:hypothetical protein